MRNLLLYILPLAAIMACSEEPIEPEFYIDPELKPFFDEFMHEAEIRGVEINIPKSFTMTFVEDLPGVAVCRRRSSAPNDFQRIHIHPDFKEHHEFHQRFIVFHELGHCFLDRAHNWYNEYSIMFYDQRRGIMPAVAKFANFSNYDKMIDELFQYSK